MSTMCKFQMTYQLAMAASQDAGNLNMRRNGRTQWNEDDWDAASATFHRIYNGGENAVVNDRRTS